MAIQHFYRKPALSEYQVQLLKENLKKQYNISIESIETEYCFNVEYSDNYKLNEQELKTLVWLLSETFEPENFSINVSFLDNINNNKHSGNGQIVEVGPRMNFTTTYSTNATSICQSCNLSAVKRIERSRRYLIRTISDSGKMDEAQLQQFIDSIHDKMTECYYGAPIESFDTGITPKPFTHIPVMEEGRAALERINVEMGLAFDDQDLALYTDLFQNYLKRNPSDVECFDIGQSNSEHSRHWFFNGNLIIDGKKSDKTLFQIVKDTLKANPQNSLIAFSDNSSSIKGFETKVLVPKSPVQASEYIEGQRDQPIIFTAETHNFPSGVAPFPGAETGTGGRLRDTHATGRGSLVVAGTVGYCVGNLNIPGYELPWEDKNYQYPFNLATPLKIEIEASNGASDYGNKFGEPVIIGFTRSYGNTLPNGERREWIKPIMFSGGIGFMDSRHLKKEQPEVGMVVVKAGGPAYRIGMGGGSASSMVGGDNKQELDFSAVQRGDAEMGQKLNRIIRGCVESEIHGQKNPIVSVHDQGAGGAGNVLKEIADPLGAKIYLDRFNLGDPTLSAMEIWGAEYQEQDAILIKQQDKEYLEKISKRERLPIAFVGDVTGDGYAQLITKDGETPVNLPLEKVLQKMPPKTFILERVNKTLQPFALPSEILQNKQSAFNESLDRVLKLLSVGSKRFLINKVDRAVTGLVARQQACGPLHCPVSNVAVIASSYFSKTGAATSIGEQPIKGFLSAKSMAYLTVGEALTNLMWASITDLSDVKCSGNWMWAAKLKGEGSELYDAAVEMHDAMVELGIAIDGGKDSLSMAAKAPKIDGTQELVKAPGALVVSTYVPCDDVTLTITPDLKLSSADDSAIIYLDLGCGNNFIGGSALTQVYSQIGNDQPHHDTKLIKNTFCAVQKLVKSKLLSAGHDRSDGGLITTLVEMSLSGNRGMNIDLPKELCNGASDTMDIIKLLFSEELGAVIEVKKSNVKQVQEILQSFNVPNYIIGNTACGNSANEDHFILKVNGQLIYDISLPELCRKWEETSYQLELLQANPAFIQNEMKNLIKRAVGKGKGPNYNMTFNISPVSSELALLASKAPKVAIIREEGSNGDREMAAAFHFAGFQSYDVAMSDLLNGNIILDERFKGVAFVGGFSYSDVMDSAKGWAGSILFNPTVSKQFESFYQRPDTFSLGLCNGCQLMALLGWVPFRGIEQTKQPRFIHNASGRFESRWVNVKILQSNSVLLKGMEGSVLGVWAQHGEGKLWCEDQSIIDEINKNNLSPIRYVDDNGEITESYPFNPSGTQNGMGSLVSKDGRHLAMMPHPERSFLSWQWPHVPDNIKQNIASDVNQQSPWMKIFQNAKQFCDSN
ncbi:phosphoribosylformylglycinamide synthase [Dictyostelium purpureum]|uniref:phosphoribosylformylglycinamidine synthase n=1 Tax=Dictyostelium purpureum TaxID=5786 RepID=F1A0K6_DICPU|nr:phosphoribosylformylglycinamide synthase [Dictyostelium purpureum]EGC30271.1 phosphoribosylformylglycinamide synthase [Dictyostelium purpureum]|eukprot:XP_003293198.1 phosphoribosylformylglycinamide synthase [Dictyostelium purpureum]